MELTRNGTDGRVYGGDPSLIHVLDGMREAMGRDLAMMLDMLMRFRAEGRSVDQKIVQKLCPGCYMIVAFDMLIALADDNGQSRTELARCMGNAFSQLLNNPDSGMTEEIYVLLDPCD